MFTLFSDVSLDPRTGVAGYGAWAKKDGWEKGQFLGGPLAGCFTASSSAELHGVLYALSAFGDDLLDVEMFIIQCDSTTALGMILTWLHWARPTAPKGKADAWVTPVRRTKLKDQDVAALKEIAAIISERPLYLRHVRAHQTSDETRSWVNEQCDAEAKRQMSAERSARQAHITPALEGDAQ